MEELQEAYLFTEPTYDRAGNFLGYTQNHSKTLRMSITEVQDMTKRFPFFSFHPLYLDWWIVGFNKKL